MNPNLTLAKRIRFIRCRQKLSQQAFANFVGVSKNKVWRWENNQGIPNGADLQKLSTSCQVSTDWFLGIDESSLLSAGF